MHHENEPSNEETPQPTVELPAGQWQSPPATGGPGSASSETPGEHTSQPDATSETPGEHTAPPAEHVPAATEQFPPATDHGYVTPPPPPVAPGGGGGGYGPGPDQPRRQHRGKLVAAIVVGVLLLGGVAFAGVMLVSKSSAAPDQLAHMVPASDQLYVTAYLDPGADQKINLRDLLQRFPAMHGKDPTQKLDETLEQALKPSGLSYTADVKPWLGTQIALSGQLDDSGNPDAAVLIASKDDQKALHTMHRVEGLSSNAEFKWRTATYKGVDVRVGQGPASGGGFAGAHGAAYAVVDHTLVIATGLDRMQRVIDADQGAGDVLSDDENFQKARDALPDEVLGMAYVNLGDLIDKTIPQLEAGLGFSELPAGCGGGRDQLTKSLDAIRAFRGLAFSVTAQTDGLQLDAGISLDRSKLPSAAASAVESGDHQNAGLSFTPKDAFGVVAFNGAGLLTTELDAFQKCQPDLKRQLDQFGVKDILSNLSGDLAVEVGPGGSNGVPGGALIAAVKDEGKMRTALDRLAAKLLQQSGAPASQHPTSETYQDVTIESIQPPDGGGGDVTPSWAVTDGVAIIATSPDEVKATIDAHKGDDITSSPTFSQAAQRVDVNGSDLVYADVSTILDTVEAGMSSSDPGVADFRKVTENLRPVKATILQSGLDGDVITVRWFFLVP